MVEFCSQLEKLMPAEELRFEATPGFGVYKRYLTHAIGHPAKMNTTLLEFMIKTFTQPGEVILDPMCGSGSMGVVAALLDRRAVQVDIEKKFVDWAEEAKRKVIAESILWTEESIRNICGDARKLSELLNEADAVVTSPPYSQVISKRSGGANSLRKEFKRGISTETARGQYSQSEENIGNLKHGDVDAVITSPPYADLSVISYDNAEWTKHFQKQLRENGYIEWEGKRYTEAEWRAMNHGRIDGRTTSGMKKGTVGYSEVDAVITSPPYADGFKPGAQDSEKRLQKLIEVDKKSVEKGQKWATTSKEALERRLAQQDGGYGKTKENIGNLSFDAVITSPPYGEAQQGSGIAKKGYHGKKHSPTDLVGNRSYMPDKFESEQNISKLPLGNVDAVITSPPYHPSSETGKGLTKKGKKAMEKSQNRRYTDKSMANALAYSEDPQNIGNLPRGNIDAVITSPPYGDSKKQPHRIDLEHEVLSMETDSRPDTKHRRTPGRVRAIKSLLSGYGNEQSNIGNLPVDAVITSPPYEQTKTFQDIEFMKSIAQDQSDKLRRGENKGHYRTAEAEKRSLDKLQTGNIESKNNIGNLGKETYLQAMLKVYLEMFKVLKPNGLAIIVIKPFIRNKQVVDLPWHTWLLLDRAGFRLVRLLKLRLEQESFWRVIYHQKYNAPKIAHEYILVLQK